MFYKVLGLMSGTSLDGLDMAYCEFEENEGLWHYKIPKAETFAYDDKIRSFLLNCERCSGEDLSYADYELGKFFGKCAFEFLEKHSLEVDFISSHGQTIFHQPEKGFTTQIGNLSALACFSQRTVVGDFRSMDVALKGQGAPLVPIGDRLLFGQYDCCLNLGGFSNISFEQESKRIAYDICPTNMVLNYLSMQKGLAYDKDGYLASKGKIDEALLQTLNSIPYYKDMQHHSLGKEWVNKYIFPLINSFPLSVEDLLATYTEHLTTQIAKHIKGDTLVTGGGAYNKHLIQSLKNKTKHHIIIPDKQTIDFKEALIFAFLGVRRMRGEVNCLASVTGATQDSCSGCVVLKPNK